MKLMEALRELFHFFRKYLIISMRCNDINCNLPNSTRFGHFAIGCVIGSNVESGENCKIRQGLVIGNRHGSHDVNIGDNVEFGSNVTVLGEVNIGDNVTIGAGSVVLEDVPSNCVVVGKPAKIVRRKDSNPEKKQDRRE